MDKNCNGCGLIFREKNLTNGTCEACMERRKKFTTEDNRFLQSKSKRVTNSEEDLINFPAHYTQGGIEPVDYIRANNLDFFEGNIIKYTTRYKHKNGLQDLEKARFYLNKIIENYERTKNDDEGMTL